MIKEQVLKAFRALGFFPEEIEYFGYRIDYEGLPVIYMEDEEESKCLTLFVPHVFDISDDNRLSVLKAMAKLCCKVKYVQPNIMFENQISLNYQHYVGDNEVTEALIEHMITLLEYSTKSFNKIIKGDDNDD